MAQVLFYNAKKKTFERVERHVVAVVDRCLVLQGAASQQHHPSRDRRIQLPGCGRRAGVAVASAAEVDATEKMVDALLLDQTDVVG